MGIIRKRTQTKMKQRTYYLLIIMIFAWLAAMCTPRNIYVSTDEALATDGSSNSEHNTDDTASNTLPDSESSSVTETDSDSEQTNTDSAQTNTDSNDDLQCTPSRIKGLTGFESESAGNELWATGCENHVILHFQNDTLQSCTILEEEQHPEAIWADTAGSAYIVTAALDAGLDCTSSKIWHHNGNTLSNIFSIDCIHFKDIQGLSAANIIAIGTTKSNQGVIYQFNGTNWTEITIAESLPPLLAIAKTANDDLLVTGNEGTLLKYDTDSSWYSPVTDATEQMQFSKVWVAPETNDTYVITTNFSDHPNDVIRLKGTEWTDTSAWPNRPQDEKFVDVWGPETNSIFVATQGGNSDAPTGKIRHFDGTNWTEIHAETHHFSSLWGNSKNHVYASFSQKGAILKFDGNQWSTLYEAN